MAELKCFVFKLFRLRASSEGHLYLVIYDILNNFMLLVNILGTGLAMNRAETSARSARGSQLAWFIVIYKMYATMWKMSLNCPKLN